MAMLNSFSHMDKDSWWKETKSIAQEKDFFLTDIMEVVLDCDFCNQLSPQEAIEKLHKNLRYRPSQSQPFVHTLDGV